MSIAIFAQAHFPIEDLVAALRRDGVDSIPAKLDTKPPSNTPIKKAVLVIQEQGIVSIGEKTNLVRGLLPTEASLLLCVPQPPASDRQLLLKSGVNEIITPGSWASGYVAERILAELIVAQDIQPSSCGLLQGATHKMRELYQHLEKIAPLDDPILILGESGTGKELVAHEIHRLSGRPDPFLPINCPELSPELLGSELFGHEKGAFTGALQARKGLIASTGRGTIFLDEIGDIDLAAQAKLLRVIEDRKVRPIGANHLEPVEARLVFATNRNLEEDCIDGKFRKDLYERLRGFTLILPPLRERRADLSLLFRHFLEAFNKEYGKDLKTPTSALDCLFRYDWPGNLRELRSIVRRSAAFADAAGFVSAAVLRESVRSLGPTRSQHSVTFNPAHDAWRDVLARAQKIYFRALLIESQGNKETATKLSGLSRSQFYEKLKEIERRTDETS